MASFGTKVSLHHIADEDKSVTIDNVLVDVESESTWISRRSLEMGGIATEEKDRTFTMSDGRRITRAVGYTVIRCEPGFETIDEVVFAEDRDVQLLGAKTLDGFNATVDPVNKRLVAAGPMLAPGNLRRTLTRQGFD